MELGYSPCPNDCFSFYALAHGKVAPELDARVRLEDVETLKQLARLGTFDLWQPDDAALLELPTRTGKSLVAPFQVVGSALLKTFLSDMKAQ